MSKQFKGFGKPPVKVKPTYIEVLQADRSMMERTTSTPEAYEKLREHGYCNHVSSYTTSMMGALANAAQGDLGATIFCAGKAYEYPSRMSYASERWDWMRETIMTNSGIDIGTPESHGFEPPTELEKVYRE